MNAIIQDLIRKADAATKLGDHASAGEYHREACDQCSSVGDVTGTVEQANLASAAYRRAGFAVHAERMEKLGERLAAAT